MATCWQSAIGTASPFKTFEARSALCFTVASRCHFERAGQLDVVRLPGEHQVLATLPGTAFPAG